MGSQGVYIRPRRSVSHQTAANEFFGAFGNVFPYWFFKAYFFCQGVFVDLLDCRSSEEVCSAQQQVCHYTHCPYVNFLAVVLLFYQLWSHVERRTQYDYKCVFVLAKLSREPEVNEFDIEPSYFVEHYVFQL